jgi:hypothetical protein
MTLDEPNQKLRYDLRAAASALDEVAIAICHDATTQDDAARAAFMDRIVALHEHIDVLRAYADEVKAGRIVRARE